MVTKNILYLRRVDLPAKSANSINSMRLCEAFARRNYTVELWAGNNNSDSIKDVFKFYGMSPIFSILFFSKGKSFWGGGLLTAFIMALKAKLKKNTVIYGRDAYSLAFTALLGSKVVLDAHAPPLIEKTGFKGWLLKQFYRSDNLAFVTIISEALFEEYKFAGVEASKIRLVRNAAKPIEIARRKTNNQFTVGYTGHLYQGRGINLIIELAKENQDVKFMIVGGHDADVDYWRKSCDLENVEFVGFVKPNRLNEFFAMFDVLIAPYQEDVRHQDRSKNQAAYMSPVKLFEYMSTGLPIVTSDIPSIRQILNNEIAFLLPPNEVTSWSDTLRSLKKDPQLAAMVGAKAKAYFESNFSWEKRIDKLENIFSEL